MPFLPSERTQLLAVKGVGPTVIARLEQMGFESFAHLRKANALDILSQGAKLTGSSCWKNSPQARAAINAAIGAAIAAQGGVPALKVALPTTGKAVSKVAKKTNPKSAS